MPILLLLLMIMLYDQDLKYMIAPGKQNRHNKRLETT